MGNSEPGNRDLAAGAWFLPGSFFQEAAVPMLVGDRHATVIGCNHAFAELLGYSDPSELIGQAFAGLTPPEDAELTGRIRRQLISGELKHARIERRFFHQSGERVWVDCDLTRVDDENGELKYVLAVALDSDSRQAGKLLVEGDSDVSTNILAALSDGNIGCLVLENDRITYANEAYISMSGYSLAELRALESYSILVAPDDRERVAHMQSQVRGQDSAVGESSVISKEGRLVPVEFSTKHIDRGQNVVQTIAIIRDLTQRNKILQELQEAAERADAASKAKSSYLSRVSHELRTPLTTIIGYADLLRQGEPFVSDPKVTSAITRASEALLSMIDKVLDIARIESGTDKVDIEDVPLAESVRSALELAEQHAGAHNVTIENKVEDIGLTVRANKQRVQQILWNFVSNAVKYGGGKVTVGAQKSNGRIRVSVTDNGPGIPQDKQELLFQPFQRLGLEKSRVEGVGLGLAISKSFAQAMDGDVGFESASGGGCTFWVDLLPSTVNARSAPTTESKNGKPGSEGSVLVVDDAESTVMLMKRIFDARPGYEVVGASTGAEAIEKASSHSFDLILLDLHLPDLNGDEVIRRLRAQNSTRDVPVVIVTADAVSSQADALRKVGANDYVTKPFRTHELLDLVDGYIEHARARV